MLLSRFLAAGILAALLDGVVAKTNFQERKSGENEGVLLEDTVFWGRAIRQVYMSVTPAPTPSPTSLPKIDVSLCCVAFLSNEQSAHFLASNSID
jgi:hypothetical protein